MADGTESCLSGLHFPLSALVPKFDTRSEAFLQEYPTYDGRGIVIGILDTGVDPHAFGLQRTSAGDPKIIDLIDTTGSGDVDMSCVRTTISEKNREIESLHGKVLKIPDSWCNPTGKWHIGAKSEYDFLPSAVKSRTQEDFMRDVWEPNHSRLLAKAINDLEHFNLQHSELKLPLDLLLEKENLEAKVEILEKLSNKVSLPGDVFDCIVFHDGQSWSAVLDLSGDGDFVSSEVLKPFKETGQTIKLGDVTLSVNIYDDGNTLSLVTAGGAHGTHVASIAAAYVPECQEMNGVAPGAQIVSIKIGDTRLGTMETAPSLIRACSVAVSSAVDIINLSYGETSHWANKGAVLELMAEVCRKHNIVFVASAGNNGPALSTVGCPGGNTSGLIGVGAFVSTEMMSAEYSMTHTKPALPYTWSSRGPACDGDLGVCITAPGGAVASVPNWTLRKNQLMNGTSMSCPNACGCIALLLSALRSRNVPYNPAFVKKIIENTAVPLGKYDPFSVGHGIIQVDRAYDAALKGLQSGLVGIQVSVGENGRGIYLREPYQVGKLTVVSVSVEPLFYSNAGAEQKINFQLQLILITTASWVNSPKYLALWNGVRQFKVEVDPRNLESGVHYSEVMAYVPDDERGPIFRIPVTVVIPEILTDKTKGIFHVPDLVLLRNDVKRFFFHVPKGVTWADVELMGVKCETQSRIVVHSLQLLPEKSFREHENNEVVTVEPEGCTDLVIKVVGGYTMELCLAPYWSELSDITLSLKMTFHGVLPGSTSLIFNEPNMWTSLQVTCAFREEDIFPEFKLTHAIAYKRPFSNKIRPLGVRDILPNGTRPFELILSYRFHVNQATDVWPEFPLISDLLYENPYSGQLWMIFTINKQFVCAGDAYSKKYKSRLDKDDYILKLQVCHAKQQELKKLTEMPVCLHSKLTSSLTIEVFATRYEIFTGSNVTHKLLHPGVEACLYLRALRYEKFSKCGAHYGNILSGHFTFSKREQIKRKVGYAFEYVVGPNLNKPLEPSTGENNPMQKQYTDTLRDLKINSMKTGLLCMEELQEEYSDDIHFLLAKLQHLTQKEDCSYESVEIVVSKVLSKVDMTDILANMGLQTDLYGTSDSDQESFADKRRQLVECLILEGTVLMRIQPASDRLKRIYMDLHYLLNKKDTKLREFKLRYAEECGHFATAIRLIDEDNDRNRHLDEKLLHCYRELGWKHYATLQEKWLLRKYPPNYLSF